MRSITYGGQRLQVEIVSLALPRGSGLMSGVPSGASQTASLTMLCPIELPIRAVFYLENADDAPLQVRVLGCALHSDGRFLVVGAVV